MSGHRDKGDGWDEIVQTSVLPVEAPRVWASVVSPAGINIELKPLRMTIPKHFGPGTIEDVPLGKPLGRSWVLLAGLIPVDFDDVTIVERTPGTRFLERSATSTATVWQHEREVLAADGGATLTDVLTYRVRPHMRLLRRPYRRMMATVFARRHAQLARAFAASPQPSRKGQ